MCSCAFAYVRVCIYALTHVNFLCVECMKVCVCVEAWNRKVSLSSL